MENLNSNGSIMKNIQAMENKKKFEIVKQH